MICDNYIRKYFLKKNASVLTNENNMTGNYL